jgi:TIR domain
MIVILSSKSLETSSKAIAEMLTDAFKSRVQISLVDAAAPLPWEAEVTWDDLLIVVYDATPFPDSGSKFISQYLAGRKGEGLLLPIALSSAHARPPQAAEAIKAFLFDSSEPGISQRLIQRIGSMLGLRILNRGTQIFISYRASDGAAIALQIEHRLKSLGYPVWRDEAPELDGDTKILPGTPVQRQIDDGLARANIVLLLDTPQAPHSSWIKHEVDTANGLLVPILPICFRREGDPKKGPRFRSLQDLQRWIEMPLVEPQQAPPLTNDNLNLLISGMEQYLCELFQRKCRIPFLVEKEFVARNYSWKMLDQRLLMCESVKSRSFRSTTKVLSHCSVFEQVHGPTMQVFSAFLRSSGRPNHALYIYDGELIPEPELKEIIESSEKADGVVILHHQELSALIDSDFTTFTP